MSHAPKPKTVYWLLQTLTWSVYGTIGYISNRNFISDIPATSTAGVAYSGAAILFLSTHLLRNHSLSANWISLSFRKLIFRLALSTLLISTISQLLVSLIMFWPFDLFTVERPYSIIFLFIYIFQTQIILMLWSLAFFSYHAIRNYKSEEIEKWRLQAAVKDAELIALKAQINPHFIFNCLNNIRALVLEDSEKARDAITKLSELLRRSMRSNQVETITIADELATVIDYLDLEKIHMENRLRYSIETDTQCDAYEIPPMAIQLLAENAIKHGLSKLPSGGEIVINTRGERGKLVLEVLNTGRLAAPHLESHGIGLNNIRERLKLLCGPSASL
ncbi:histidine kinase, partial [Pelagicoccus sp. SDUM812002]|uniref:sensor histidine kinase n=1 Tax=Pelagicoccus sp. SDUM812002 TaxID=3041266 RepID=UPI00280E792D